MRLLRVLLSINGIRPDRKAIIAGRYPIMASYFLTYDKARERKVRHFFDFVCSPAGRKVIDRVMVAAGRAAPKAVASPAR